MEQSHLLVESGLHNISMVEHLDRHNQMLVVQHIHIVDHLVQLLMVVEVAGGAGTNGGSSSGGDGGAGLAFVQSFQDQLLHHI